MVNFSDRAEKMEKYTKSYVQEHSPERPPYCMSQRACDYKVHQAHALLTAKKHGGRRLG